MHGDEGHLMQEPQTETPLNIGSHKAWIAPLMPLSMVSFPGCQQQHLIGETIKNLSHVVLGKSLKWTPGF